MIMKKKANKVVSHEFTDGVEKIFESTKIDASIVENVEESVEVANKKIHDVLEDLDLEEVGKETTVFKGVEEPIQITDNGSKQAAINSPKIQDVTRNCEKEDVQEPKDQTDTLRKRGVKDGPSFSLGLTQANGENVNNFTLMEFRNAAGLDGPSFSLGLTQPDGGDKNKEDLLSQNLRDIAKNLSKEFSETVEYKDVKETKDQSDNLRKIAEKEGPNFSLGLTQRDAGDSQNFIDIAKNHSKDFSETMVDKVVEEPKNQIDNFRKMVETEVPSFSLGFVGSYNGCAFWILSMVVIFLMVVLV